jgi:transposase
MSMQPQPWPEVPAETARVARRAFRKGTLAIRARDELGSWCDDEDFAAVYGVRGKPGISPAQLAMVTVLQFTENLTDRQAADAARGRLDWKYCLGLSPEDEGFDFSVLSEFRSRLVAGSPDLALLDLPAVEVLRVIWVQQYYRSAGEHGEKVVRREASEHGLPPGRARIVSPYDTDARYPEKHGKSWLGYKAHFSETCSEAPDDDPVTGLAPVPNLITAVATTHAAVPDAAMTTAIHDALDDAGLAPGEHAVDAGYTSADLLLAARARGITLLGPLLANVSPQARAGRYATDAFAIDWDNRQVTCPQGATSTIWSPCSQRGTEVIVVRFAAAAAINLIRLDAWWTRKPLDRTRTTHLQRLDFTVAA